jgi:hypothetical protein
MATILPWLVCICSYFFLHNIVPNAHGFNPAGLPATTSTTKRVVRISSIVDKSVPRGTLPSTINNHQFSERNVVSSVSQLGLAFHPTTYMTVLLRLKQKILSLIGATSQGAGLAIRQYWWCFPMMLALVPMYAILTGEYARMPEFWPLIDLGFLKDMPISFAGFLGSNIFYLLSGLFLLNKIHVPNSSSQKGESFERKKISFHTSRNPMLGVLVMTSGFVSLTYHTFQALGRLEIAESLCFVDHGVAISCFFYFLQRCGIPSYKTLSIGIPSMCLLSFPVVETYPFLHSIWHLLSAGTTISWAFDGVDKRKKFISSELRRRKGLKKL